MVRHFENILLFGSRGGEAILEVLKGQPDLVFEGGRGRGDAIQLNGELAGHGNEFIAGLEDERVYLGELGLGVRDVGWIDGLLSRGHGGSCCSLAIGAASCGFNF